MTLLEFIKNASVEEAAKAILWVNFCSKMCVCSERCSVKMNEGCVNSMIKKLNSTYPKK